MSSRHAEIQARKACGQQYILDKQSFRTGIQARETGFHAKQACIQASRHSGQSGIEARHSTRFVFKQGRQDFGQAVRQALRQDRNSRHAVSQVGIPVRQMFSPGWQEFRPVRQAYQPGSHAGRHSFRPGRLSGIEARQSGNEARQAYRPGSQVGRYSVEAGSRSGQAGVEAEEALSKADAQAKQTLRKGRHSAR
jgi:hypothetical protein